MGGCCSDEFIQSRVRRSSDWMIERTIEKYLENRSRWDFLLFTIDFLMFKNIYAHTFYTPMMWGCRNVEYIQSVHHIAKRWLKKGGKIEKRREN